VSGPPSTDVPIVVMGVSGSGKSRVAKACSKRWGYVYIEADDLHSAEAIAKMASGHPLDDSDRLPWLRRVGELIREEQSIGRRTVTACSALKRAYRDILREYAPDAFFVMLDRPFDVVRARVESRHHSFMPAALLESQYEALEPLEPDESGIRIDLSSTRDVVRAIGRALEKG
jgi:gluconokinase